jgi:hypothetical protein
LQHELLPDTRNLREVDFGIGTAPNRLAYADLGDWTLHDRGVTPYTDVEANQLNLDKALGEYSRYGIHSSKLSVPESLRKIRSHRLPTKKPDRPPGSTLDLSGEVVSSRKRFLTLSNMMIGSILQSQSL